MWFKKLIQASPGGSGVKNLPANPATREQLPRSNKDPVLRKANPINPNN